MNTQFKNLLIDTNPAAEKIQIELLRKASAAKKFSLVRSLSRTVIQLSRRAILRANPNLNEIERNIIFVRNHYGKELAQKLEEYLRKRNYDPT